MEIFNNDLGDAISKMAQYCENEKDFLELAEVLVEEVNDEAIAWGCFGSRSRGDNHLNSDLDIFIIKRNQIVSAPANISRGYKGNRKTLNNNTYRNWIDLLRVDVQSLRKDLKKYPENYPLLESVNFKWSAEDFDLESF